MTVWRFLYWVIFTATGVVYGIMIFSTLPAISEGAAGLMPFDMRPFGYTSTEAQAFLDALTEEARAAYLGPQRRLDSVFPALFGLSLIGAYIVLIPRRDLRRGLILVAIGAVAADYVENARVALMLSHDGVVPGAVVSAASQATVIKSILNAIATLSFLAALGLAVMAKRKSR